MTSGTKVGVLGSGEVDRALAAGLARHGYDVVIGSREPAKLAAWRKGLSGHLATGTFAEAAQHGSLVVLATLGAGAESAVDLAGPARFDGKVVIDATNPLEMSGGAPGLFVGTTDSLSERIQRKLPKAHVVKCFNTVSNTQMVDPKFAEPKPPMLIAGDDAEAKRRVTTLVKDLGWPGALDVGGIDGARWLEALVPLWVRVAQARGGAWGHAFKSVD